MRAIRFDPDAWQEFTQEHRRIYKATDEEIVIISCEGHY
nr:type II toxin-antitoxin system YoeB family toxin [Rudanella lutea]